jgi:hypothetical protein
MHFADQASAAECACVALRNQDGGQPWKRCYVQHLSPTKEVLKLGICD